MHIILSKNIHPNLWQSFEKISTFLSKTEMLLDYLQNQQKLSKIQKTTNNFTLVHNLSKQQIDKQVTEVLNKSFNLRAAQTPRPNINKQKKVLKIQ